MNDLDLIRTHNPWPGVQAVSKIHECAASLKNKEVLVKLVTDCFFLIIIMDYKLGLNIWVTKTGLNPIWSERKSPKNNLQLLSSHVNATIRP